jgi:hypothetical protein
MPPRPLVHFFVPAAACRTKTCTPCGGTYCPICDATAECPWCRGRGLPREELGIAQCRPSRNRHDPFLVLCTTDSFFDELSALAAAALTFASPAEKRGFEERRAYGFFVVFYPPAALRPWFEEHRLPFLQSYMIECVRGYAPWTRPPVRHVGVFCDTPHEFRLTMVDDASLPSGAARTATWNIVAATARHAQGFATALGIQRAKEVSGPNRRLWRVADCEDLGPLP